MKNNSVIKPLILIFTVALFLAFVYDISTGSIRTYSFAFLVICTLIIVVTFSGNLPNTAVFYVMLSGFFVKLAYVIYTPVWCRQHDVVDFGAGEGHAAYMEYILSHKALPDFDPRTVWAFFQPPLHHMICAVWMWINIRLGIAEEHMHKNVQILPLVYMCLLMFFVYLICKKINMKSGGTLVTMLIVSFHPIYILMSGSINNDALSVLLTVIAIYAAIIWFLYPTTGKIVVLALFIGLAMSAKLSSALIAPPVVIMMFYKIRRDTGKFKDKTKLISYILELIAFAVVVFPLGLWWSVRNKLLFDMSPTYIPEVGERVSKSGFVPTILDIRTASPFLYMKSNGFLYDEYNLILATLKSSLFGEGDFANISPAVTYVGWILLLLAAAITILCIIATVRSCKSGETECDPGIKVFLCAVIITFILGYIAFAISGGNLSAMDLRYSAAAVSILAVFLGLWHDLLGQRAARALTVTSAAFAASAGVFYILIGIFL